MLQAWLAAVGFTLQIYFDFSGYTDMACGAALFFGVRLPINFDSPLKATSIIDFWLRWHITLTRFLTAYVYNPMALALTRARAARRLPMLRARDSHPLAFLHVLALPTARHHAALGRLARRGLHLHPLGAAARGLSRRQSRLAAVRAAAGRRRRGRPAQLAGFAFTFLAVVVAMVLFRAPDLAAAGNILGGMAGLHGLGLPGRLARALGTSAMLLADGAVPVRDFAAAAAILLALLAIALLLPNSVQMLSAYEPVLYTPKRPATMPGVLPAGAPPPAALAPHRRLDGALRRHRRGVDDPAHRHERVPVLAVLKPRGRP